MCLRTGRELPRSPLRGDEVLFMAQKQRKYVWALKSVVSERIASERVSRLRLSLHHGGATLFSYCD